MKTLWIAVILLAASASSATGQVPRGTVSADQWAEDLATLRRELTGRHPDPWHAVARQVFDSALGAVPNQLAAVSRGQGVATLARLAALVGDAHTGVDLYPSDELGLRALPVRFELASDGLFIYSAAAPYADLVGMKVLNIGQVSADAAVGRIGNFISHENAMAIRARAGLTLGIPEVLVAAGIAPRADSIRVEVLSRSGPRQLVVAAISPAPGNPFALPAGWVAVAAAKVSRPDVGAGRGYFRLDEVANPPGSTLEVQIDSVIAAARSTGATAFVLDLRNNTGGDNQLIPGVVRAFVRAGDIDRPNHLFVLIGPRTASAADNLAESMRTFTKAVFMGEPTGAAPNHFGDADMITLPNTHVRVHIATTWWQFGHPHTTRPWLAPSISAPWTIESYRTGLDPVSAALLRPPGLQ
jgi:Peptidase family S41